MSKTEDPALKTPLYDLHCELGGKMVTFAGYAMPVQFPTGIMTEHKHTRAAAGLFDVSHMGQVLVSGDDATAQLERVLPVDLETLGVGQQAYTQLTNETGGILDDLIICRWSEQQFFLVVNAGCKHDDIAWLEQHLGSTCTIKSMTDQALLAVQGPQAHDVVCSLAVEAKALTFMQGCHAEIEGAACFITRSGYTGEDGFEISVANDNAEALAQRILSDQRVLPIGLGARDSLRLEAGLCLYGHELNTETSPVEAGLIWSISKSRRADGAKAGGFFGAETVLKQISNGVSRKRVGLQVNGKAPVREGAALFTAEGVACGEITSGGFGPSVGAPVAMGYVDTEQSSIGTELEAEVRGKRHSVTVAKLPFSPHNYVRAKT